MARPGRNWVTSYL